MLLLSISIRLLNQINWHATVDAKVASEERCLPHLTNRIFYFTGYQKWIFN